MSLSPHRNSIHNSSRFIQRLRNFRANFTPSLSYQFEWFSPRRISHRIQLASSGARPSEIEGFSSGFENGPLNYRFHLCRGEVSGEEKKVGIRKPDTRKAASSSKMINPRDKWPLLAFWIPVSKVFRPRYRPLSKSVHGILCSPVASKVEHCNEWFNLTSIFLHRRSKNRTK